MPGEKKICCSLARPFTPPVNILLAPVFFFLSFFPVRTVGPAGAHSAWTNKCIRQGGSKLQEPGNNLHGLKESCWQFSFEINLEEKATQTASLVVLRWCRLWNSALLQQRRWSPKASIGSSQKGHLGGTSASASWSVAVVASCVSERMFSKAGIIVNDLRARLHPEKEFAERWTFLLWLLLLLRCFKGSPH